MPVSTSLPLAAATGDGQIGPITKVLGELIAMDTEGLTSDAATQLDRVRKLQREIVSRCATPFASIAPLCGLNRLSTAYDRACVRRKLSPPARSTSPGALREVRE